MSKKMIENLIPIKELSELAKKEGNSKKPVYRIHKWWARRLGCIVRALYIASELPYDASDEEFWDKFYSKNSSDLTVLDPFMGGGTTLVEAKKMGMKTIGVDVDPLACFITKKELEECNIEKVKEQYRIIEERIAEKISNLYTTRIDGKDYEIINAFWVYEVNCPKCNSKVKTHPHYKLYYNKEQKYIFCSHCGEVAVINANSETYNCKKCGSITDIEKGTYKRGKCKCHSCNTDFMLRDRIKGSKSLRLFALEYLDGENRVFKKADYNDIKKYNEIDCNEYIEIPNSNIPTKNRKDMRPISYGYNSYDELFNKRQQVALSIIYNEIKHIRNASIREWFTITFSDSLACNNMLCNYAYGYRKLTPLFGIHAFTVPVRPVENNVWGATFGRGSFSKVFNKTIKAKEYCQDTYESKYINGKHEKIYTEESIKSKVTLNPATFYNGKSDSLILNRSSAQLKAVRDKTVDIIMTDPPYYDNLNYSELAHFYYQWIKDDIPYKFDNHIDKSLHVNDLVENYHGIFIEQLTRVFKQCYKKLKDDGLMVFSYHHNKEDAWFALSKAIQNANFICVNIFPIRSEGNSAYHSSEGSIKWDSILVFRKEEYLTKQRSSAKMKEFWEKHIVDNDLEMNESDIISFYRSLELIV
ncbi:DNA methyltransferase [Vallitalea sp.]|jgi:adenine-specific DNA methylase|uniref:DNA methyltransferase n=1 Tax=Vallitalea sp. TaxID=1882829 RepID=UPI0025FABFB7|nr:DNA methyltransferase [Vallitalea sp.]MCT4686050.1 DNA methyltransferase [Vallitalea sp.]